MPVHDPAPRAVDISVVIVNYRSTDFLRACLQSTQDRVSSRVRCEVIVVDNGSPDFDLEELADRYPAVRFVDNERNAGYAAANNRGVLLSGGRYVLFLNPDTVLRDGTLETMLEFMDTTPSAAAATCRLELPSGGLDDACHRGFPTPWNALCHFGGLSRLFPRSKVFCRYSMGWADTTTPHEIDALAGAFMLVRREAGEQVGWWDEDYFFYGEDLDFCYTLKRRGWRVYFVPHASVLHYKGAASGIRRESRAVTKADAATRTRATLARFEAMKLFYRKHYVDEYPRLLTWLVFRAIDLKQWWALRFL